MKFLNRTSICGLFAGHAILITCINRLSGL